MKILLALLAFLPFVFSQGSSCRDFSPRCRYYQSIGLCYKNQHYMNKYCKRTCGKCSGGGGSGGGGSDVLPSNCGQPSIQAGRVIAGENAKRGSWPWQIMMLFNGRKMCGGSLIALNWVVTAAHCVSGRERNPSAFSIRVGEHDDRRSEGSEDTIRVSKIIIRSDYDRRTLNNDLALMKLSRPAKFGTYVHPVCLPSQGQVHSPGSYCYITGWGKIKHPGNMHHTLQQGKLQVVSQRQCSSLNTRNVGIRITDNMVCAGDGGKTRLSGCHGDSGGPFVCQSNGRWYLQGAVSWGSGTCSSRQTYTVFAKVAAYSNWIKQQVKYN